MSDVGVRSVNLLWNESAMVWRRGAAQNILDWTGVFARRFLYFCFLFLLDYIFPNNPSWIFVCIYNK